MPLTVPAMLPTKQVVVDVELFPLQQGGHELGSTHDILVALSSRVNLLHDPDPLKIDLGRSAPELFFQPVDPCFIGLDLSCGTLLCFLFLFHFLSPFAFEFLKLVVHLLIRLPLFHFATTIERDSMPPEMFLALNPFCRRMRVA